MKKLFFVLPLIIACNKPQVYQPVGGVLTPKDMQVSKNRARGLNEKERIQIKDWMAEQSERYYPATLNYWVNIPDFATRSAATDGTHVSYSYDLYDFSPSKIYDQSIVREDQIIGKSADLTAVQDAVKYLKKGEEATLLVPSVLAYGTYGDNKSIQNDVPLIIKIRMK